MRVYDNKGRIGVESKQQMKSRGVESPNLADQLIYSYDMECVPKIEELEEIIIPKRVGFR
jgi:hypothetical protein